MFGREYKADALLCQESGLNWDRVPRVGKLEAIMKTDLIMQTVTAHNEYEMEIRKRQWGGTWAVAYGEFATQMLEVGKDETGLGRWAWMKLQGKDDHVLQNISA